MTPGLQYLTVQDILFAHFRLTGKPAPFHYDKLEEATFYQYGYGGSSDIVGQAAAFATGFRKLEPFMNSNRAVGFAALIAFLSLNGKAAKLNDDDAYEWFGNVSAAPAREAIEGILADSGAHHAPSARESIMAAIAAYPGTIQQLIAEEAPAVAH